MVGILLVFMVFSTLLVRSAIAPYETQFRAYDLKTLGFYIVGFIVVFAMALVDYRTLLKYSWYIYGEAASCLSWCSCLPRKLMERAVGS